MRTIYTIGIVVVVILLLLFCVVFYSTKSEPPEGYPAREDIVLEKVDESMRTGGGCVGPAGFEWCPSQKKCMRTWEEFCEEFAENYQGDQVEPKQILVSEGDTGINPPEESVNWEKFTSDTSEFYFQYPPAYHIVIDDEQWPHAIVQVTRDEDDQIYDLTIEKWDQEELPEIEERTEDDLSYFAIMEHPQTKELISFTCWTENAAQDCENMYLTIGFTE